MEIDRDLKLTPEQLRCDCQAEIFDFETTSELEPFSDGIIGQQRAVKSMNLGLRVEQEGYNIYMAGLSGTGRTTYAKTMARQKSQECETPSDICYVYNFNNSEKPKALELPAGLGSHLQKDMDNMITELKEDIPEAFTGEEYEELKKRIMGDYQQKSNQMMEEFEKEIRQKGFILQNTAQGPVPVPVDEDSNPINQEQFQQMGEDERNEIREKSQEVQNEMDQIMRKIRKLKTEAQNNLADEEKKIGLSVIQPVIVNLKDKYQDCQQIIKYLEEVQKDIINNLDKFKNNNKEQSTPFPFMEQDDEAFFKRYQVNLLVNNSDQEGAPVVYESNPTYYNLFGKIEGEGQMGTITTDFTMIKGGSVHKANGGYLIVKAKDVLTNPFSWQTLKRTLINQEIVVENIGEQYRTIPIKSLKPEAIEVDIKVIMIGNPLIYQLLYNYDEEFEKLFKIKADFDVEMKRSKENMYKFAAFISSIVQREGIRDFTSEAVSKVIEYSSRRTGDREKMSTRFNEILELLYEANAWADERSVDYIDAEDVITAFTEKEERSNLIEEKIQEMIARDHILVDVEGETSGQINGLSVYQTGQYSFGRPSRITARTFLGQEGVINIEREAKMSGKIHNKGVMILGGYLGGKYAKDKPLSLSASLAFEQSYGGIDGDSASCAELIALLSAISGISIKQNLAITGSMNQHGKVQPIGGVNQKIEGYYKVCKVKGLTGDQGVIIPEQNKDNLMLKEEIIEAVENGDFHIYAVGDIDKAIELMMAKPAAEVHETVSASLKDFAKKVAEYGDKNETDEN